ncbi:DUF481 domain-containing protein [Gammaproteobacteria bacterium]|nr:DUF481 domain-containing protein [Gammaproteobacteria bacterium]
MHKRITLLFPAYVILLGCLAFPAHAAKTDIVVLINGNAVTGEVKALEFGSLRYSTDSMGTVNIDWEDVVTLTSNQDLQLELVDGTRYFGSLLAPDNRFEVRIQTPSGEIIFPAQQIVRITPIETAEKFWQRLDGSFSFGFKTEKSSQLTTSDVSADISYRARQYLVGLKLSSSVTDQPSADILGRTESKARQNIEGNYQRFRPNRWFTDWFSRWERSDEQGISGRSSIGGALGRYIVQTNKNQFSITAGLQGARSSFIGEDESTTEAEGRIEFRYLRRNLVPESSITFTSKIYPLIDDLSQYRAESTLSFKREFIADLFFSLSMDYSYLSDPPSGGANEDYTVTTSLGYSF